MSLISDSARAFILAFAALCISLPSLVFANQYSLPDLLKMAEKNPAFVAGNRAGMALARAKQGQVETERWLSTFELKAFTGVVPDVDANTTSADAFLFNFDSNDLENDFSLSNLGPFGRIEVNLVQPLWTWGKVSGYQRMASKNVEITLEEEKRERQLLRQYVKKAYYTIQLSQDAIDVLKEVKEKLKSAEEKVEELLIKESDIVEENDRLKIGVFLADVENRSLDAFRGLNVARATMAELTGVTGDWQTAQPDLEPEVVRGLSKEDVIRQAVELKPKVQQLTKLIEVKRAQRQTIQSELYPTIFIAGQLEYATAPGRTDLKNPFLVDDFNKFNLGAALGLKQDLGIYRTLNKMKQLEAEVAKLESQKHLLGSMSRVEAEEGFEKALSAQQGIQISERGFRAARSWLTSTGLAFNLGTAPTKDVLESYAAYFKARVDLLRSIFSLNMALADLSVASGVEVVDRLKSDNAQ